MTKRFRALMPLVIVALVALDASAAWQEIGSVTRVTRSKTNGVVLDTSSRAKVSIEFFDLDVIRIRLAAKGAFERDFSYAIDYSHDRMTPITKLIQTPR